VGSKFRRKIKRGVVDTVRNQVLKGKKGKKVRGGAKIPGESTGGKKRKRRPTNRLCAWDAKEGMETTSQGRGLGPKREKDR